MSESYKNERIKFKKKGAQKSFIVSAKYILNFNLEQLAQKLNISQRTLSDWKRERFNMSAIAAQVLSKISGIAIPADYVIVSHRDHLRNIGKTGGKNRLVLYGKVAPDEVYRAKKWREWWEKIGQYKKKAPGFQSLMNIRIPKRDEKLAEFVGIMLGDGGIAPYYIHITLSSTEKDYALYVAELIYELFEVRPKMYPLKHSNAVTLVAQRKQLVNFCQKIGLVKGNKVRQQIDIPNWIKENEKFSIACVKGLIDTDGCFYTSSYVVNSKKYSYFKIAFTSASTPLLYSVAEILINLGIRARMCKNHKEIRVENSKCVATYVQEVGSSNAKHIEKIKQGKIVMHDKMVLPTVKEI